MKKSITTLLFILLSAQVFSQTSLETNLINVSLSVFDEKISFKIPKNFKGFQENSINGFLYKAIPQGQNFNDWTQMITVSGQKDGAMPKNFDLKNVANLYLKNQDEKCNYNFSGGIIKEAENNITVLTRCANNQTINNNLTETTVINFIQGKKDIYTLQYSEKSSEPFGINESTTKDFISKNKTLLKQ